MQYWRLCIDSLRHRGGKDAIQKLLRVAYLLYLNVIIAWVASIWNPDLQLQERNSEVLAKKQRPMKETAMSSPCRCSAVPPELQVPSRLPRTLTKLDTVAAGLARAYLTPESRVQSTVPPTTHPPRRAGARCPHHKRCIRCVPLPCKMQSLDGREPHPPFPTRTRESG